MNDDFKEELKDCYAEIESLRFQLNGVMKMRNEAEAEIELLRAVADAAHAVGFREGSAHMHKMQAAEIERLQFEIIALRALISVSGKYVVEEYKQEARDE